MKYARPKDAQATLRAVRDLALADLAATSDDEISREIIEDGGDPKKIADDVRTSLKTVVRNHLAARKA